MFVPRRSIIPEVRDCCCSMALVKQLQVLYVFEMHLLHFSDKVHYEKKCAKNTHYKSLKGQLCVLSTNTECILVPLEYNMQPKGERFRGK